MKMKMKKKKVAIIGTNGIPAKYGGFETLTQNLTSKLDEKYDFIVYCSKIHKVKIKSKPNLKLVYLPLNANGWQSIIYDSISILHSFFYSDILLVLGPIGGGFMLSLNKIFKKKIIVNYGGIEWKREKHSKLGKLFATFNYKVAAKFSQINIVDNEVVGIEVAKDFGIDNFEIIAYGGDHVSPINNFDSLLKSYPFLNEKYSFSIGRSQIDNNQHLILEAFAQMPNEKLVIVSNWEFNDYGKELKNKFLNKINIVILDAIYDQKILDTIRAKSDLYIHTQSQCGTAPSLVEAMSLNLPVISFDVPTNRSTTNEKSIYFEDAETLKNIVTKLSISEKENLRRSMYDIALSKFTWKIVSKQYQTCFDN
jgi:glycosyltransferase involved in cell wall biosynthesis